MLNLQIKVEIIPSGMQAFVTVNPKSADDTEKAKQMPSFEEILQALGEVGVKVGVDETAIRSIIEEKKWRVRVLVAEGISPVQGENGGVEYFFRTDEKPQPKELENNRVDYREIGLIHSVKKDDLLARRVPAKPGKPGMTVRGDTAPSKDGTEVFIKAGKNTYFTAGKDLELRAEMSGSVSLRSGTVQMEDSLFVKRGVNFASGNVDFPGDVVVDGDIRTGFSVKSGGKIEVRGVVEDALVEAEGDVLVKGGFKGSGRGKIISGGDVYIKFIENQFIKAAGSVHIGNACIHADIYAGESVELSKGSGAVIGGHIRANKEIIAKVLGNDKFATTTVEIFSQTIQHDSTLEEKEKELSEHKEKIKAVKATISQLQKQKLASKDYNPKLIEEIRSNQDQLQDLISKEEELSAEVTKLQIIGVGTCEGQIQALNKIYPGTRIIIDGTMLGIFEMHNKAIFKKIDEEIINVTVKSRTLA